MLQFARGHNLMLRRWGRHQPSSMQPSSLRPRYLPGPDSSSSIHAWTRRTVVDDPWFKLAKKEGYVSRAAYKLKEIQKKHKLIKPGHKVLDLGCVPGAWMQVACQELGPREKGGLVFGIDIQDIVIPTRFCDDRVRVLKADAREVEPTVFQEIAPSGFDCVLSDMLQFTTGAGNDVDLSIELASTALHIATGYYFDKYGEPYAQKMGFKHQGYLRPGGALVMKIYDGAGVQDFLKDVQSYFDKVTRMNVDASRSASREFFCIAMKRKSVRPEP
jgi:23S rRNA (uridine2552-2'-O)-methyltransferase